MSDQDDLKGKVGSETQPGLKPTITRTKDSSS